MQPRLFEYEISAPSQEFDHFYEHMVCTGIATIVLGAGWENEILRWHQELWVKY